MLNGISGDPFYCLLQIKRVLNGPEDVAPTSSLCPHGVPDVAVEVVIASQKQPATLTEGYGGDTTDDIIVRVHRQFLVGTDVEEATRGVVGASGEGISVGEELQQNGH